MTTPGHEDLRLVVPCYNEAGRLPRDAFLAFVRSRPGTVVLFVNDGSTDNTANVLRELADAAGPCVQVLDFPGNRGKAEAVRQGLVAGLDAGAAFVGYWDADLSTPLDAVARFMAIFGRRPQVDIVMGARVQLLGRDVQRRLFRHYAGRVFATAASLALGVRVYDTQCGAKIFRASEAVAAVFQSPFRSAWAFDVEILARYISATGPSDAESRLYELPLQAWRDVPGSKVKLRHGLRAAWDLWRIRSAMRSVRR